MKNNVEESKRVFTKYAESNPKNICALRMRAEFLRSYGNANDKKTLLLSYIDWAAEDPSSDVAYSQLFELILGKSKKVDIESDVSEKLSKIVLGRLTNCAPQDWMPWAYLTMLLRQGVGIEPMWSQKTWATIHLSPFKGVEGPEYDRDYVLAKAAFCEAVYGMEDQLTQWWIHGLDCPKKFETIDEYAMYYAKKRKSKVYKIISHELDGLFGGVSGDSELESRSSQSAPIPTKKVKLN